MTRLVQWNLSRVLHTTARSDTDLVKLHFLFVWPHLVLEGGRENVKKTDQGFCKKRIVKQTDSRAFYFEHFRRKEQYYFFIFFFYVLHDIAFPDLELIFKPFTKPKKISIVQSGTSSARVRSRSSHGQRLWCGVLATGRRQSIWKSHQSW